MVQTTVKNSNIGKFYDVQDMISKMISDTGIIDAATVKANALALNNAIPVNYIFEQNSKDMNNLLLSHDGIITAENISSNDKTIMENIAWQCPYKGGKAPAPASKIITTKQTSEQLPQVVHACGKHAMENQINNNQKII